MSQSNQIARYVGGKIEFVHNNRDRSAILAKLRRAVGKETGTVPNVWEFTLDLPEELKGKGESSSFAENAVFATLTLYAMHAQGSKDNANVHSAEAGSLGRAASRLKMKFPENEKGIKRRFDALATAKSYREITNHARGMIQLLKAGGVELDYIQFARDVFSLQFPDSAKSVKLKWGRDYYSYSQNEGGEDNEQSNR
jgi:CRISPR system Cascade subunit CasB